MRSHLVGLSLVTTSPLSLLVVTSTTDDGTGTVCGSFSHALAQASQGMTVSFTLAGGNTISFTGSLTPAVKSGVTVNGGGGAGVVLNGNGVAGDGLRLSGQDSLLNLTIRHFGRRELVALAGGNRLRQVVIRPS